MMRPLILTAACMLMLPVPAAAQSPVDARALTIGETTAIARIDGERIKGQPSRLAWSPDGREIYVQMMDGQFAQPDAKLSHHVITLDGGERRQVDAEPPWVSEYWTAKSGQASPDGADFKIELKQEVRTEKTVSTPMGGDLARGGVVGSAGTSSGDAVAAAYARQSVPVITILLHGEIVGEFVNSVLVPGLTFGWGPKGSKVVAYSAHKNGRVTIMDATGAKRDVDGSRDSLLPGFSPDGARVAWLQKDGKAFNLRIVALR